MNKLLREIPRYAAVAFLPIVGLLLLHSARAGLLRLDVPVSTFIAMACGLVGTYAAWQRGKSIEADIRRELREREAAARESSNIWPSSPPPVVRPLPQLSEQDSSGFPVSHI